MKLVRSGEAITCENGHIICEAAMDLHSGMEGPKGEQFTNWVQPAPEPHQSVEPCAVCGSAFIRSKSNGGKDLHTQRGWVFSD